MSFLKDNNDKLRRELSFREGQLEGARQKVRHLAKQNLALSGAIRELLEMLALVPEEMLTSLRIDPYVTIGDALELIGKSRDQDSWTALQALLRGEEATS